MNNVISVLSICVIVTAVLPPPSDAAHPEQHARLGVTVSAGIGRSHERWNFEGHPDDVSVAMTSYFSGGFVYGPVLSIAPTHLLLSVEVATNNVGTGETQLMSGDTGQFDIRTTPVLLWVNFRGPGRFAPFVRAGIGAALVEFAEKYEFSPDTIIDYWTLSFGLGGGLEYMVSPSVGLGVFVDVVLAPENRKETRPSGRTTGVLDTAGFGSAGVRLVVWM